MRKQRLPKDEYFKQQLEAAKAQGADELVAYYNHRLAQLAAPDKVEAIKTYLKEEKERMRRSIIAVPSGEYLEEFCKANHGTSDFLLMQMSILHGAKLALENVEMILSGTDES